MSINSRQFLKLEILKTFIHSLRSSTALKGFVIFPHTVVDPFFIQNNQLSSIIKQANENHVVDSGRPW